jgi:hypothetical protein
MTKNGDQTPEAGGPEPKQPEETTPKGGANRYEQERKRASEPLPQKPEPKPLEEMSVEELIASHKNMEEALGYLQKKLQATQFQLGKTQSVELKWSKKDQDISGISVKSYGHHSLNAADESINTISSILVTLQHIGFLQDVEMIRQLPGYEAMSKAMEKASEEE